MINVRLITLLSDAKKYVYYKVLSQSISLFLRIITTFIASYLINSFFDGSLSKGKILSGFLITFFSLFGIYISEKFCIRFTTLAGLNVKSILRKKIYSKLIKLGIYYNQKFATSNLVQLSVEGVDQLEVCFGQYLPQLYYSLISSILLFMSISFINLATAIYLLLCVPLIPISLVFVQSIAIKILGKYWKSYTDLGETFLENLQGLTTLKIFQYDDKKSLEMDDQAEKFRKETMKLLVMQLNSISVMDIMSNGGSVLGILVALYKFKNNIISFGGIMAIILFSAEFFIPLRRLGSYFHVAMNGITASEKIFNFLDLEEEPDKTKIISEKEKINILLKNMNFFYKKEKNIFNNLNLSINSNEFIAFVGESGCGKSTLAKIISGNLNSYSGNILIQNNELKEINKESISKNIVVISSDSYIFKGTIRDNLLMSKENATDEEMINILKEVKLEDILLKNGLDSNVEEEGQNLSGGQRQKLALARGLLVDAPFYIFDEATSNIDKESESDIIKVIQSLIRKKTIILISHRLGNVVNCDKIYLLENGEIKESGTHEELLHLKGKYYKLYHTQKELENYSLKHKKDKKINIIDNNCLSLNNEDFATFEVKGSKNENENIYLKKEIEIKEKIIEDIEEKKFSNFEIIKSLFELVKPLMKVMYLAIIFGVVGFLFAIFIPIKGMQYTFIYYEKEEISFKGKLFLFAVFRGFLDYAEQYCNHYIAFKLLALIRHIIFQKLRILCPAKLENKEKGNLISIITSDIELIEVFYAHTISPINIAIFVSSYMCIFIGKNSYFAGIVVFISYCFLGIWVPLLFSPRVEKAALKYRNQTGDMNSFMLTSLRGINETLQYRNGQKRLKEIENKCGELGKLKIELSKIEEIQKAITNIIVLGSSYGVFYYLIFKLYNKEIGLYEVLISFISIISSFGPVIALSNLSTGFSQTLASAKRIKHLLDEEPVINEIKYNKIKDENIYIDKINFSYKNITKNGKNFRVFKDFNYTIPKSKIIGIHGKSGCGKSTLLKLLMRFWDVDSGEIKFGNENIKEIDINDLRKFESYLTQETYLFNDTIEANLRLANESATKQEIIEAAKKASIHNFIMTLPNKYNTKVGELGNSLSSGEKQRIGVARAFLHYPKLLLLDEPTSNLDSLNEGIILKSIIEEQKEKTVIIVSHRESTLNCVDELLKFK